MCRDYLESNPECCDYIRSERSSTLRLDIVNRCSYLDQQLTAVGARRTMLFHCGRRLCTLPAANVQDQP